MWENYERSDVHGIENARRVASESCDECTLADLGEPAAAGQRLRRNQLLKKQAFGRRSVQKNELGALVFTDYWD